MSRAIIELLRVSKSFGATRALDSVSFDLRPGEVHVLAGENGAGKSTLIRILSGAITDFEGELLIDGRRAHFSRPADAARAKIATIHQELSLIGAMSVADNFALAWPRPIWGTRRPALDRARARALLDELELDVGPDQSVERLPLSLRQQLEIARALAQGARVIVMDEPTSALAEQEAERLFSRIRALRERATAIVYISHRMDEIFSLADRISVLRDGKRVLTAPREQLDHGALIEAMLGRAARAHTAAATTPSDELALDVRALSLRDPAQPSRLVLDNVSFSVRRGEILGIAGLAGSGGSTLLHALFGSRGPLANGSVRLQARAFSPKSPRDSIARGIVLLASDRALSLVAELAIAKNASLSGLGRWSHFGFIDRRAESAAVGELLARLGISGARDLGAPVRTLSGGNQQKVALARCLLPEPRVLLLDEPGRGIDVGAKADLARLIRELAASGVAIVAVSSEIEELIALVDRVIVLARGRVVDELVRAELTRERVLASAMGAAS